VFINGQEGSAEKQPLPLSTESDLQGEQTLPLRFLCSDDTYAPANASISDFTYRPLRNCPGRDEALLQKLAVRLQGEAAYVGLLMSELVVLAEALDSLEVRDSAALRTLGQEILGRRNELTPDEVNRVHIAFKQCKMPLSAIWETVGVKRKRRSNEVVTMQSFAPRHGHERLDAEVVWCELEQARTQHYSTAAAVLEGFVIREAGVAGCRIAKARVEYLPFSPFAKPCTAVDQPVPAHPDRDSNGIDHLRAIGLVDAPVAAPVLLRRHG